MPSGSPGGKSSKWVKNGCARCGRGNHWARECKAKLDVDGNPPREKPPPRAKGGGKGLQSLDDEGNDHNDADEAREEQGDTHALDSDGDGEIGDMFMLQEDSDEDEDVHEGCCCTDEDDDADQLCVLDMDACMPCDPWTMSDPWGEYSPSKCAQGVRCSNNKCAISASPLTTYQHTPPPTKHATSKPALTANPPTIMDGQRNQHISF